MLFTICMFGLALVCAGLVGLLIGYRAAPRGREDESGFHFDE